MAISDIKASEKFEVGWGKINLFTDKKIHKMLFVYVLATFLFYIINILGYPSQSPIGKVIDHSIISFFLFFVGSLWIQGILSKKYFKIILLFLITNSLFYYLSTLNNYFSIGYLLNFILIKKLISENEEKMEDLGLSFKNLKRNIIIGITIGFLGAVYGFFIFLLTQGYEFKILGFDKYLESFLGIFILFLFIFTFFIGLIFNYLLKKGVNIFASIITVIFLFVIYGFGQVEIFKDIQAIFGYLFFIIIWTFIYCGIFLLCRNLVPIALFYTITAMIALSFMVGK